MAAAAKFLFDVDFAPARSRWRSRCRRPSTRSSSPRPRAVATRTGYAAGETRCQGARRSAAARRPSSRSAMRISRLARGLDAVQTGWRPRPSRSRSAVGRKLAPALIARAAVRGDRGAGARGFPPDSTTHRMWWCASTMRCSTWRASGLTRWPGLRGFEGRLVILAEPEIALGDCRVEWADGGVIRDRAAIEAAIDDAVEPLYRRLPRRAGKRSRRSPK